MHDVEVTIGICTKNSGETISKTLRSILSQKFELDDVEIIVVDGGSSDYTVDIIKGLIIDKVNVNIYYDGGKGLGYARQIIVDKAKGKYVLWLDSDVILSNSFLNEQYNYLENNPDTGLCRGVSVYVETKSYLSNLHNLLFCALDIITFGATISRLNAIRQVGGFDTSIKGAAEDVDLKIRMISKGWKFDVNNKAIFYHIPKDTVKSLYKQYKWYGYGDYLINTKYVDVINILLYLPPLYFGWLLRVARVAYARSGKKLSFFIPFFGIFINFCWWMGFFSAHLDKYGRK